MSKDTKKRIIGLAWTTAGFLLGSFIWAYANGNSRVNELKNNQG